MFGISQIEIRPRAVSLRETLWALSSVEQTRGWLGAVTISHGQAAELIKLSFATVLGRLPQGNEAVFAQAVSLCETGYGSSWDKVCGGAGSGSNNMGAVQAGAPPCNPDTSFECGDTHADGEPYAACFRKYPTPQDGMNGFISVLYKQRPKVLQVASTGSIREFSTTLRESKYFELPLEKHIKALTKCLNSVTTALHVPMPPSGAVMQKEDNFWWYVAGAAGIGYLLWRR